MKNINIEFFMTFLAKNYLKCLIECNYVIKLTLSFTGLSKNYKKIEKQNFLSNIIYYYRKYLH